MSQRRDTLITNILRRIETKLGIAAGQKSARERVRAVRAEIASQFFRQDVDQNSEIHFRQDVMAVDMIQEMISYPVSYLDDDGVTDTRIVETIQRMEESILGKADCSVPLRAVIQIGEPIYVPAEKAPRGEVDPLMLQLKTQLQEMLDELAGEARPFADYC